MGRWPWVIHDAFTGRVWKIEDAPLRVLLASLERPWWVKIDDRTIDFENQVLTEVVRRNHWKALL